MKDDFKKVYTNAIFRGKMLFAIETWGGVTKGLKTTVQKTAGQSCKAGPARHPKV